MFTVIIRGLELYAFHGASAEERSLGHRYRVDLSLLVDGRADQTDRLEDTVDYGIVAALLQRIVMGRQFQTVERLAAVCADELLANFAIVKTLEIRIAKRMPPMAYVVEEAGVKLTKSRSRQ
jgi:7,8-dihydroneopterin aldolase/epimerase/oxygenase